MAESNLNNEPQSPQDGGGNKLQKVVVNAPENDSVSLYQVLDDFHIEVPSRDIHGRVKRVVSKLSEKTVKAKYTELYIKGIPFFESECCIPEHKNYLSFMGTSKNIYAPLDIKPQQGNCYTWVKFIRHIGQGQYEILLTYLIVMFQYPVKKLPILCLVSEENATGKSTFANKIAYLLGRNAGFYSQSDLESQFNIWVMNLLAVFEEIHDTKKVAGKLKDISTSKQTTVNRKGMQQFQFEPFVKIFIISNNEDTCIQLNENDNRYLVLKVPPIPKEDFDIDFEKKLDKEASAMLWYLLNTEPTIKEQSRMWFPLDMLRTKQLDIMVEANKSDLYHSIRIATMELMDEIRRDLYVRVKDLEALLHYKYSVSQISTSLRKEFKMKPTEKTVRWLPYYGNEQETDKITGQPYVFKYENNDESADM